MVEAIVAGVSIAAVVIAALLGWGLRTPPPPPAVTVAWTGVEPFGDTVDELLLGCLATLGLADPAATDTPLSWLHEAHPEVAPSIRAAVADPGDASAIRAANDALRDAGHRVAIVGGGAIQPLVVRGQRRIDGREVLAVEGPLPDPVAVGPERVVVSLDAVWSWFWEAVDDPALRTSAFEAVPPEAIAALTRPIETDTLAGRLPAGSVELVGAILRAEVARLAGAGLARSLGGAPEHAGPVEIDVPDVTRRVLR